MNESRVRSPIVLVHGILGFTELRLGNVKFGDYFRGIREALQANGNTVPEPPRLNPAGSVAERAQDLKRYLETSLSGQQVHLLAHSMGGLDSRYLISMGRWSATTWLWFDIGRRQMRAGR
jgi:triacylglycerol lipase